MMYYSHEFINKLEIETGFVRPSVRIFSEINATNTLIKMKRNEAGTFGTP